MVTRNNKGQFIKGHMSGKDSPTWKGGKKTLACLIDQNTFEADPGRKSKYCSRKCYWISKKGVKPEWLDRTGSVPWNKGIKWIENTGEKHIRWKGGYWINDQGYKILENQTETNGGRVREHRKIVEDFIGRKLNEEEVIHHINGDKLDNRIENLKILTQSEHIKLHHKIGTFKYGPHKKRG